MLAGPGPSQFRRCHALLPVSSIGHDLLHSANVFLGERVESLGYLLGGKVGVVENLLAFAFLGFGHLVNVHNDLGWGAVLHGGHLGLAIERVFDEEVVLIPFGADGFPDGGVALGLVALALLLAEGFGTAEFE